MALLHWRTLLLLLLLLVDAQAAGARRKRLVAFRKGSNMFYRLNYKVNTLAYTTIFAQASGFKVAWSLPSTGEQRSGGRSTSSMSLQDARDSAELVYESHGFNGKMCLLKSLCQAMEYVRLRDGVLMKILALLAGSQAGGNSSSLLDPFVCGDYASRCPLHLLGSTAFAES